MEIDDSNPRCMNTSCKKIWSFEFLSENFPINFHNKKYRERRASILVGREKSMLPFTKSTSVTFWATNGKFGLLLIITFGHTDAYLVTSTLKII